MASLLFAGLDRMPFHASAPFQKFCTHTHTHTHTKHNRCLLFLPSYNSRMHQHSGLAGMCGRVLSPQAVYDGLTFLQIPGRRSGVLVGLSLHSERTRPRSLHTGPGQHLQMHGFFKSESQGKRGKRSWAAHTGHSPCTCSVAVTPAIKLQKQPACAEVCSFSCLVSDASILLVQV